MTKPDGDRRTVLVSALAIGAVIVAGAFAVGANIGILDASSESRIGDLAAAGDLVPTTATALAPVTTPPSPSGTGAGQTYDVAEAGTVAVDTAGDPLVATVTGIRDGWTWAAGPSDEDSAEITFTGAGRTLVFTATRAADGTVAATVEDVTSTAAGAATSTPSRGGGDDAGDRDEEEEHEGRDDDD